MKVVKVKENRRCHRCSGIITKGSNAKTWTVGSRMRYWKHNDSKTCQKFELSYKIADLLIEDLALQKEVKEAFSCKKKMSIQELEQELGFEIEIIK